MSPPTIRSTPGNTASQTQGPQYAKVFVQRDYSDGTAVKFLTNFPQELENKVSASRAVLYNRYVDGTIVFFDRRSSVQCSNILSTS